MLMSYLDDFLGQSWVEPVELLPVGDEQLEHVAGRLSHGFVLKLDKQAEVEGVGVKGMEGDQSIVDI